MKKIAAIALSLMLVLSLSACGNEAESSKKTEEKPQTTTVAATTITTTTPTATEDENTTTTTTTATASAETMTTLSETTTKTKTTTTATKKTEASKTTTTKNPTTTTSKATTPKKTTTTKVTTKEPNKGKEVMLDVEPILGALDLPSGSGITASAVVLKYYGIDENILILEQYADIWASTIIEDYTTPSPWDVIVGDPHIRIAQYWAKPIIDMVNNYAKDKNIDISCTDISGLSINDICNYIDNGKPIIVWGTSSGKPSEDGFSWITPSGDKYTSKEKVRVYVVVGYNNDVIFFYNDIESLIELPKDDFKAMFESVYSQAILIE